MKAYALTPQDAWFFRDGRPYNLGESNQSDTRSIFPPPARTLTGAMRAALARANNWNGRDRWSPELESAFGRGPNDLGGLQFVGPFLIKDKKAFWPMPRHVLGRKQDRWQPVAFLRPDETRKTHLTDAGDQNLPVIDLPPSEKGDGLKPADTTWISVQALKSILEGKLPSASDIAEQKELWELESRVGLHRDTLKRTTGKGALYSPAYVRLHRKVALGIAMAETPGDLKTDPPALFPLGGESRLAQCESWTGELLPAVPPRESFTPDETGRIRFTVILLTPGSFTQPPLAGATVVSACVGKPVFIGGWDSLNREPLPLQPFKPAGSIWFCTVDKAEFAAIHAQHGKHLGAHTKHGFGQIVIGRWPQPSH